MSAQTKELAAMICGTVGSFLGYLTASKAVFVDPKWESIAMATGATLMGIAVRLGYSSRIDQGSEQLKLPLPPPK